MKKKKKKEWVAKWAISMEIFPSLHLIHVYHYAHRATRGVQVVTISGYYL
jgi:hypothetical protein